MSDTIEKTIDLAAPIDRVWHAISDHEAFGTWFKVKLDAPFAVGRETRGQMRVPGYEHIVWRATVVAIDPPNFSRSHGYLTRSIRRSITSAKSRRASNSVSSPRHRVRG